MSPEIIAALITVGGTILVLPLGHWLQRSTKPRGSNKDDAAPVVSLPTTAPFPDKGRPPIRHLNQPHQLRFVKSLPELKEVTCKNAREGWNTGVTADMRQASYDVIDFLIDTWVKLAGFYPERQFEGKAARGFIDSYVRSRFEYHWAKHEPKGIGSRGTMVGVLVGGDVIEDLDCMVVDMVSTLALDAETIDFEAWNVAWGLHPDSLIDSFGQVNSRSVEKPVLVRHGLNCD